MALGAWFDQNYFAAQKIAQMTVLGEDIPAGSTPLAQLQAAIDAYNAANPGQNVTVESNFEACNQGGYIASVVPSTAINVSPNALFDVTYYLTSAAKYANDNGYTADGFSLPWTAQTVLEHMYQDGYSAWEHFKNAGLDERLDCSADFSTSKYIAAKAVALDITEDEVVAQMKADGLNPVMDYFENGVGLGISEADLAPDAALSVTMQPGQQWGTMEGPGSDPYDNVQAYVDIEAGNTGPYAGDNGVNTQFDAKHVIAAGQSTLNANDQITADPTAMNTLAVEINTDWNGFKGIAPEGKDFVMPEDYLPNVTGVGRIKLDRAALSSEQDITFDAKNISDDAVQFDLNASGTGTTSLKSLSDAVQRVNITGLLKSTDTTQASTDLNFVSDAGSGKTDTLTIGVDDVYAKGGMHKIGGSGIENFENLVVDAMGGKSGLDVANFTGAKAVTVTGAGALTLGVDLTGKVKTLDASQTSGGVNFYLNADSSNNQAITGGSGQDTVTIADTSAADATFKAANWSSIESVAFNNAGDVTIKAKGGAEGLNTFWISTDAANTVTDLAASDVTVYQAKVVDKIGDIQATTIDGGKKGEGLGNVTWYSHATDGDNPDGQAVVANFSSNGTGTATIELTEEDTIGDGSIFAFSKASAVKLVSPNASADSVTVVLDAGSATSLDITLDGGIVLKGSDTNAGAPTASSGKLSHVQNLTVNLTNDSNDAAAFNMGAYHLDGLQKGLINADGEDITLGNIGLDDKGAGFTLNINDANTVTINGMYAGRGNNVNAQIGADGDVAITNIKTGTNQNVNNQGDVTLVVTTDEGDFISESIRGGQLNLNLSGVEGDVAADAAVDESTPASGNVELFAQERIIYQGATGSNHITVTSVGKGTTSNISLGDESDTLEIDLASTTKFGTSKTTLNVELGDGEDTVVVTKGAATGVLRLNISDWEAGDTVEIDAGIAGIDYPAKSLSLLDTEIEEDGDPAAGDESEGPTPLEQLQTALKAAGLSSSLANLTWTEGKAYDSNSGTAYFASSDVVIVVAGVDSQDEADAIFSDGSGNG